MKLRTKLITAFLFVGALGAAAGLTGLAGINRSSRNTEVLAEQNTRTVEMMNALDSCQTAQLAFKTQVQEWKNILLRGSDPANFEKYRTAFTNEAAKTVMELSQLRSQAPASLNLNASIDAAIQEHRALLTNYVAALQLYKSDQPDSASVVDRKVRGIDRKATEQLDAIADTIGKAAAEQAAATRTRVLGDVGRISRLTIITIAICTGIATVLGIVLGTGLSQPIVSAARTLADGAAQTASSARQIEGSSQTLASGASEQAASLEETSASLEEMSAMTRRNADSATKARELSTRTRESAESGLSEVAELTAAMGQIKESSDNIAKIIRTIDELAFQTNILALNAAVEAARAGEAGMGFAVVADEVRNLAQRSAQAARDTAERIEESITRSRRGSEISGKVSSRLQVIVESARAVDGTIAEMANACREQSIGIQQVATAVSQMDQVTQGTAATAEESAAAAEELRAQAETLRTAVQSLLKLVGQTSATNSTQIDSSTAKENHSSPTKPGLASSLKHGNLPAQRTTLNSTHPSATEPGTPEVTDDAFKSF